nr:uncharacterized protein LOC113816209 [Penaeus vannamei]
MIFTDNHLDAGRCVVAAFVWAVAGAAWALEEGGVGSLYDQYFPPLHPNCAQSLTDLLLRQESQLRESAGILKEILSETKGSLATEASCSGTFRKFGGTCLYLPRTSKKLGMLLGPSARTWEETWPCSATPTHSQRLLDTLKL